MANGVRQLAENCSTTRVQELSSPKPIEAARYLHSHAHLPRNVRQNFLVARNIVADGAQNVRMAGSLFTAAAQP